MPVNSGESPDDLVSYLRDKQLLLMLDNNCEHLVDSCARLAHAVLQACPQVRILATSRESLRISGELVFAVPPLSLPAPQSTKPGDEIRYDADGVRRSSESTVGRGQSDGATSPDP